MFRRFCRFFLVAAALVAAPLAQAQLVIPGGGGGASVGGSSGQLQFNNAGVLGGGAGTAWDDTNRTLTISGATVTSSKPMLDLSQTWNAGAVAFTGLKFNATDTASASGSLLMDLQVGGVSKFSVDKSGGVSAGKLNGGVLYIDQGGAVANFAFGNDASYALTSGVGNFFMGLHAGQLVTTGINNTAIGWDSQMFNVSGQDNTSLGEDALKNVTGDKNTAVGYTAGYGITSGQQNVAIAPLSLYQVTTGSYNVAVGHNAGYGLTGAAARNTLVGYGILNNASSAATDNTALGYGAGYYATGNSNIFLGQSAGLNSTGNGQLYIDSFGGSSSTALIYGVMTGAAATQSLQINGTLKIGASDTILARDAADTLAMRRGTNAQIFNIYSTYTDALNNAGTRLATSSGNGYLFTYGAGTGTGGQLYFGVNSGLNWLINTGGHWLAFTDNTFDIGASGANRPRNAFMANNITVGGAVITSFINNGNNANTIFQFTNSSANAQFAPGASTPLLQLGGTTSSFPAIKRNAAAINFRLADDTGDAAVTASGFTSTTAGLGLGMAAGGEVFWNGRGQIFSPADGQLKLSNWAATAGAILDFATDATVKFRNTANSADAAITAASISTSSTTLHTTTVALTNGAAAAFGTLTNAPAAGNPTKWIPINDNGTTRYIPAW